MSLPGPSTSRSRDTEIFTDWWNAWIFYVLGYSVGTITLELAEPTQDGLAYPALGLALLVWLAEKSGWFSSEVTSWLGTWVPMLVAAVVIALTA